MSYILDALRKSEQERRQADPSVLGSIAADTVALPRPSFTPFLVAGASLLVALAVAIFWAYRDNRPTASTATITSSAPTRGTTTTEPPVLAEPAARVPDASERVAPELKRSPFAPPQEDGTVRDLANEARVDSPPKPAALEPAPAPIVPAPPVIARAASPPTFAADPIKFLFAMPPEFQRALPELTVNIHIYAPHDADRILYINNRQYQAGDRVRDDIVLEEIVPDGAVMNYRGQRFKLPRPR